MNITFCTKRDHSLLSRTIKQVDNLDCIQDFIERNVYLPIDLETNSLRPYDADVLLMSIGNEKEQFVIDAPCFDLSVLNKPLSNPGKLAIGQNFKYDKSILALNGITSLPNTFDTLIAEQCLRRGAGTSNALDKIILRRLRVSLPLEKSTRDDFIIMNKRSLFKDKHIVYSAGDIQYLIPLMRVQRQIINNNRCNHSIYNIEMPFVDLIKEMELEGLGIDEQAWTKLLKDNEKKAFGLERELDIELKKIDPKPFIGMARERVKMNVEQIDIFGNVTVTTNKNVNHINYASPPQLVSVFTKLGEKPPYKLDGKFEKSSFEREATDRFLIENRFSKMVPFVQKLQEYKEAKKAVTSFGEKFIKPYVIKNKKRTYGYLNEKTNRVHTIYRQCATANNRLASGDSKIGFPNMQNIKKLKIYRNCFVLTPEEIQEGWKMFTIDYSGAELIILGALSKDYKLIELESKDIHSYLATAAFNKIIEFILKSEDKEIIERDLGHLLKANKIYKLLNDKDGNPISDEECKKITDERVAQVIRDGCFEVNKKTAPDIRGPFKNVVYGVSYGASDFKIAQTLNVPVEWAKLVLKSMAEEIPDSMTFLDKVSKDAVEKGYMTFNQRSGSRHYFKQFLDARQYNTRMSYTEEGEIRRAAKNYIISGTQADMIKEAGVNVMNWRNKYNVDVKFALQVHDEYVFKIKKSAGLEIEQIAECISTIMNKTANLYLNGVTQMSNEYDILDCWTK